ncbi:MAG: hypothetical protein ABI813_01920 [Bacteroidota bacterium]
MYRKLIGHFGLRIYIFCFLCGINMAVQSQEQDLQRQFTAYSVQTMQEKLYAHTDKSYYLAGEICWFKIYNVDAFFNKPLDISKVAYVELLDKNNKPVLQASVALKNGDGNGSLQIPGSLSSGEYLFRAYTRWMKNFNAGYFFEKPVTIINTRKIYEGSTGGQKVSYDLQFFPEGGNLVNGLQSKIAFRIVDQNGKGQSCTGVIINDQSDTLVNYSTLKFGMGSFLLKPEQGRSYRTVITLPGGSRLEKPLPAAYNNGYVMQVTGIANGQLKITVQSNVGSSYLYLFAHTRGSVKQASAAEIRNGIAEFTIDTAKLAEGISHITIFNGNRQPVCERLFFKKPAQRLDLQALTDKPEYDARKKVTLRISSSSPDGMPLAADLSMAVYRIDSLTRPDAMDISSYLWLSSDLVGAVESPGYYFTSDDPLLESAADNLMLTQGWRRFRWDDILRNQKPVFEFTPEFKGNIVKGKVVDNANGLPLSGVESFLSVVSTRSQFRSTFSDDSGVIKFEMNHFYGNNEIIVQTTGQEKGLRHVEIASPFAAKYADSMLPAFSLPQHNTATLFSQNASVQVQNAFLGNKLKEMMPLAIDTTPFYSKPDRTYLLDDYVRFTTMEEVLREYVPEVNVRKQNGKFYLPVFDNIRHEFFKVDPLILLDGVAVLDPDKIMAYDPLKIRKLEVVARMYFYGNMSFGGIVNFTTYHGDLTGYELDPHATVIDYETLQMQREFFSPVYETPEQVRGRLPDFRNLLYWSPAASTGKNGKNEINFYTSDLAGRFAVVVEGLTAEGKTGSKTIFFQVREDTRTAAKK